MTDLLDRVATPIDIEPPLPEAKPKEKTASEVIMQSIRYIEEHGWIKDYTENAQGNVCMVGALFQVGYIGGNQETFSASTRALAKYLRMISTGNIRDIPHYNDLNSTTFADVKRVMQGAAEYARQQEQSND